MLSTLDLVNEVCDIIFTILVTFLAVEFVDLVSGPCFVFLHRLNCVEAEVAVFKRAADFVIVRHLGIYGSLISWAGFDYRRLCLRD